MEELSKNGRRDFLRDVALGTAAVLLWGCSDNPSPFNDSERECVVALAEQIIPRDDFPGATDLGVINYIENWLTIYYPERLPFYHDGILALQESSNKLCGKNFQELDASVQVEIMKKMETYKLPSEYWKTVSQGEFFNEILDRTMQGFYGNPRHGGNKDFASYKMMNLDSPLVIGQNRYKNV